MIKATVTVEQFVNLMYLNQCCQHNVLISNAQDKSAQINFALMTLDPDVDEAIIALSSAASQESKDDQ